MKYVFLILALLVVICKTSRSYELSYDAIKVLDYDAEESVYYCSGRQAASFQYIQKEQGIELPTATLLSHTSTVLVKMTGERESKISELVIKGYDDMNNCAFNTTVNSSEWNECMKINHQCQDVSEDFYGQFVKK